MQIDVRQIRPGENAVKLNEKRMIHDSWNRHGSVKPFQHIRGFDVEE